MLSSEAIGSCCRFLTEAVLGVARVDHVDVAGDAHDPIDLTIKVAAP